MKIDVSFCIWRSISVNCKLHTIARSKNWSGRSGSPGPGFAAGLRRSSERKRITKPNAAQLQVFSQCCLLLFLFAVASVLSLLNLKLHCQLFSSAVALWIANLQCEFGATWLQPHSRMPQFQLEAMLFANLQPQHNVVQLSPIPILQCQTNQFQAL